MRWNIRSVLGATVGLLILAGCDRAGPSGHSVGHSPAEVGRLACENLLNEELSLHYSCACAYYGLLRFAEATGDAALRGRAVARLEPILSGRWIPPTGHVDFNVFGIVPLEVYRQTGDERGLAVGIRLADDEFGDAGQDGLSRYTRFWVDDMYMVGSLQAQAARATGQARYAQRAARQLLAYIQRLQQPGGLFRHGLRSPHLWGRGNGWAAAGMTEVLRALPAESPLRPALLDAYRRQMDGLLACQDPSGGWRQVLDRRESYLESSCTGMFVFAMASGVAEGRLPAAPFEAAARRGWRWLADQTDADGRLRSVCIGTRQRPDLKFYLNRPRFTGDLHGQAALLWAATAMLRLDAATSASGPTATTPASGKVIRRQPPASQPAGRLGY